MVSPAEVERIRQLLKRKFTGEDVLEALRTRLQIHLTDPLLDPLSRQVWESYKKLPELLEEPFSILDAGCMSGFLFHHLKRHKKDYTYTGIDRWPEAIQVGLEFQPDLDLRVADFIAFNEGKYDYVWCSNIPWKSEFSVARANFLSMAKRKVIFAHPNQELEIYGV